MQRRFVVILALALTACAATESTPQIAISPGFAERIAIMDAYRHYGSPRRILPHVTVEALDPSEDDASDAGPAE